MDNTFLSAINDLVEIYCSRVSDEYFENDNIQPCNLNIVDDVVDDFLNIEEQEYVEKNLCILALEYYNLMCNIEGSDYYNIDDDIIDNMKSLTREEFINFLYSNTDNISHIFLEILNEYIGIFPLNEYKYYGIEHILENKNSFDLYKKFHPNLIDEIKNYKEYKIDSDILSEIYDTNIYSLIELIYLTIIASSLLTEDELIELVHDKVWFIKITNDELYKEVILFLSKYYYICVKKRLSEYGNVGIGEVTAYEFLMESEPSEIIQKAPEYILINNFINFNILDYLDEEKKLNSEEKKFIKKFELK